MKKPLIVISLIFLTASFSFAASGQGLTSWDAQIEPVASSDLVGITDISDTTQSDNGSSKKATMTQVGAFMATLFTSKTGNETIAGIKTFTSSPIVPTPTTDMQVATKKYVDDNSGTGTVSVVQTVSPTGSTTSAPSEAAVGTGLAAKQNADELQVVSAAVQAMMGSESNTEILSTIGAAPAGTTGASQISDLTDWPTQISAAEVAYLDGVSFNLATALQDIIVRIDALEGTSTVPVLSSVSINSLGSTLTISSLMSLEFGTGGNTGVFVDCNSGGTGLIPTYTSGSGSTSLLYTLSPPIVVDDVCYFRYTQPGDGIKSVDTGAELASITGTNRMIDNQSGYVAGGPLDFGADLVSMWPMTSGLTDTEGNNNLSARGTPTYSELGMQTTAFDTYAWIYDTSLNQIDLSGSFTIGFYSTITSEPDDSKIFSKWDAATNNREFDFIRESSNASLVVSVSSDGTERVDLASAAGDFPLNTTIHWIVSHNAVTHELEVYKNGQELVSGSFPATLPYVPFAVGPAQLSFNGSYYTNVRPAIGYMKDAFYIKRAITAEEALGVYENGL
jgi:hypothetical protein